MVEMPIGEYDEEHGEPRRLLRQDEARGAALPAAAGPSPFVPSIEELAELNRRIHEDAGLPGAFALDQRAPLCSCLTQVGAFATSSPEDVVRAAALLAHGIAQAQAYRDGNRRTAFFAARAFLERHDLAYISRGDDDMLARYLNQVVERQGRFHIPRPPGPDKFAKLFLRRLATRTPPSD